MIELFDKEKLKSCLTRYVESVTVHSKGKNQYVCPLCGSGTGKHGTGAFTIDDNGTYWKCFSCGESGDVYELYGKLNGTDSKANFTDCYNGIEKLYGNSVPAERSNKQMQMSNKAQQEQERQSVDYTTFFLQAHQNIGQTEYAHKRGLTDEVIERFNIGFMPEWRHPEHPYTPTSPRLIIPTSKHSYLARDVRADKDIPDKQKDFKKQKVGDELFNVSALATSRKPIYIVEGQIDAMSVIVADGEAIGLGSTTNRVKFIKTLAELMQSGKFCGQPLILALDNDDSGRECTLKLSAELDRLHAKYIMFNPYANCKDANETLVADNSFFYRQIKEGESKSLERTDREQAELDEYNSINAGVNLQAFCERVNNGENSKYIPTGFKYLDEKTLDGGMYNGLYLVGAISSLGKTTFCMQLADNIAYSGKDVLIFSLEMSRDELMAKSISRETAKCTLDHIQYASTSRVILSAEKREKLTVIERGIIQSAINNYQQYANHVYIVEGSGDVGTDKIRETVQKHISFTGKPPIVIVDYLQMITPLDPRMTDKQATDRAVLELKRISRDFKTPVIAISSLNRSNYDTPISMEALKESGGLEYGSDVIFGLQLKGVGGKDFDVNKAKSAAPRQIELIILKNRNGRTGDTINFKYYPFCNYFEESKEQKEK